MVLFLYFERGGGNTPVKRNDVDGGFWPLMLSFPHEQFPFPNIHASDEWNTFLWGGGQKTPRILETLARVKVGGRGENTS